MIVKETNKASAIVSVNDEACACEVANDFDLEGIEPCFITMGNPSNSSPTVDHNCFLVSHLSHLYVYNFFPPKPLQSHSANKHGHGTVMESGLMSRNMLNLDKKYSMAGHKKIELLALSPRSDGKLHPFPIMIAFSDEQFSVYLLSDFISLKSTVEDFRCDSDDKDGENMETGYDLAKLPYEHNDFINDLSFDPSGTLLSTISDDNTCRIWNIVEETQQFSMVFDWRPVCFKWHHTDFRQFLVFLSSGSIMLYNLDHKTPIMSLQSLTHGINRGDWSIANSSLVCATLLNNSCLLWSLTESAMPIEPSLTVAKGKVDLIAWSKCRDETFAMTTFGQECCLWIVDYTNLLSSKVVVTFKEHVKWIEWLPNENTCAVLSQSKLFFVHLK